MKLIGLFVLIHCIVTLAAGILLPLQPWIVWKWLAAGCKAGYLAVLVLIVMRVIKYSKRN